MQPTADLRQLCRDFRIQWIHPSMRQKWMSLVLLRGALLRTFATMSNVWTLFNNRIGSRLQEIYATFFFRWHAHKVVLFFRDWVEKKTFLSPASECLDRVVTSPHEITELCS